MRRKVHHCYGIVIVWLLAMGWTLGSNAASTSLAPVTNTGLNNIHFKSVRCGEAGFWMFDVINNNFSPSTVEYLFWLEDDQGDAIDGDAGQLNLAPKSRASVTLKFGCDVAFTELKPHFRWAPVGFTRP